MVRATNPQDYEDLKPFARSPTQLKYLDAVIECGTLKKAAVKLDVNLRTVAYTLNRIRKEAISRGHSPEHGWTQTVPEGYHIKGISDYRKTETGYQWVKSDRDKEAQQEAFKDFVEGMCADIIPKKKTKIVKGTESNLMSILPVGDAHIGMYSHQPETGQDFDVEIAIQRNTDAIDYLVESAPKSEVGVLVNVGDFVHIDDSSNRTPQSKNVLDVDTRHTHVMTQAGALLAYMVDKMLTRFGRVVAINAIGNHDPHSAVALSMFLNAYYRNDPRVEAPVTESAFHYIEWGQHLIGVNHGDKMKAQQLRDEMTMHPYWGDAKYRRWIIGHWHHKEAIDLKGVLIETFATLAGPDGWHKEQGFGWANKTMELITLHKERGNHSRLIYQLD